jgi:F-type H+-transporting ATPase subunit delta
MSLAVASRYANALADVVLATKGELQPESVLQNLRDLEQIVLESSEFRNVLASPAIAASGKQAVMAKICDRLGVHRLVRNFVFLVVRNRRGQLFPQLRQAFERVIDERMGVVQADVQSAAELNPASQANLEAQLGRVTGRRVRLRYTTDPSLLGGAIARIGSTVYDGSVRGQLESLRRKLTAGA